MSYIFEQPFNAPQATFADGEATLMQIGAQASEYFQMVENMNSRYVAMNKAYEARISAILSATGQQLKNPLVVDDSNTQMTNPFATGLSRATALRENQMAVENQIADFDRQLLALQDRFPDASNAIRANVPVATDAAQTALKSERELARLSQSNPGILTEGAKFVGSMHGWLQDPLQVATLAAGGPGSAAGRSVASRIMQTAIREATINGAMEATAQPAVQAWREEIGLESGLIEGLKNVAFATVAAGGLGALGQGGAEVVKRFMTPRQVKDAAEQLINNPKVPEALRKGLAGDARAAKDLLSSLREDLPPSARGAIDELELDEFQDTYALDLDAPETLFDQLDRAERAIDGDMDAHLEMIERPGDLAEKLPTPHDYAKDLPSSRLVDDPFDLDPAELDYELDLLSQENLDMAVPNEDGDIVPLRDLIEGARFGDDLARIVANCKI
jgi:hypothetical protein